MSSFKLIIKKTNNSEQPAKALMRCLRKEDIRVDKKLPNRCSVRKCKREPVTPACADTGEPGHTGGGGMELLGLACLAGASVKV